MARFVPVSRGRHGAQRWRRGAGYGFAAADALAPVAGVELGQVVRSMPLAFAEQSGHYALVGVMSLAAGRNMFVGPDEKWLGSYVPAFYRLHPFCVVASEGAQEPVICVDEESGLVVEGGSSGEAFFDEAGALSPALKLVMEFLIQVEQSRRATDHAVATLAEAGVIRPWPITLKTDQGEQAVAGLYRIDEAALGALPDECFLRLRAASAFPIAYAQLFSAGNLAIFEQLAKVHAQLAPPPVAVMPEDLDRFFGLSNEGMEIRFD